MGEDKVKEGKTGTVRIGTRKSILALAQTTIVVKKINKKFPQLKVEIVPMSTKGDKQLDQTLASFGGKGVFTKELDQALLDGEIDIAVHSAKDMPVVMPEGLMLAGVIERADVRDVIVTKDGTALKRFSEGVVVGTGSLRRELQIRSVNPKIEVKQIRGNVQTRLQKLADGQYDAIVLAAAGLERLMDNENDTFDYRQFKYEYLDTETVLPAAGQAVIAIETCEKNTNMRNMLEAISDIDTWRCLEAERRFLECIGGGCNAPAAAYAKIEGSKMMMDAMYVPEGSLAIHKLSRTTSKINGYMMGEMMAKLLLENEELSYE